METYMAQSSDIYGQQKRFDSYMKRIQESPTISPVNKAHITRFFKDRAKKAAGSISIHRQTQYVQRLLSLAAWLGPRDFTALTPDDYLELGDKVNNKVIEYSGNATNHTQPKAGRPISLETKRIYATTLKKFLRWLKGWKEYPQELTDAFTFNGKAKTVNPEDLLTVSELERMMGAANNLRDKALIACLAETGDRISELGTMQIKNVRADEHGFILGMNHSKTIIRSVRMLFYGVHLKNWLIAHPNKDNPEAALWVKQEGKNKGVRMGYAHLRMTLIRAASTAGIAKHVNPHSFRHLKVSRLASMGMSEAQICKIMGWVQGSRMMKTYSHLNEKEVDDAYLIAAGFKKTDLKSITSSCPHCGIIVKPADENCPSCKMPLQINASITYDLRLESVIARLAQLEPLLAQLEKIKT